MNDSNEDDRSYIRDAPSDALLQVGSQGASAADSPTMESRRGRGGQGQGERNRTSKPSKPLKGVKPIRDKDGEITGWEVKDDTGRSVPKTLEWGKQNGLNPKDFQTKARPESATPPTPADPTADSGGGTKMVIGVIVVGAAVACAIAEPCGAAVATAMGVGGTAVLATQ